MLKKFSKIILQHNPINDIVDMLITFTNNHVDREFSIYTTENSFTVKLKPISEIEIEDENYMEIEEEEIISEELYEASTVTSQIDDTDTNYDNTIDTANEDINTQVTCPCGVSFSSFKDLHDHTTMVHKKKTPTAPMSPEKSRMLLTCKESNCNIVLKDKKYMKIHAKAHESFDAIIPHLPNYQCPECNLFFSNDSDLSTHTEMHQNGFWDDKQIQVISQPSVFDDHFLTQDLVKEENNEEDEIIYTCGHCGISKSEHALKLHILFMHTYSIQCPFDARVFEGKKQVRIFVDHVKNKHPEIFHKKVEYSCTYCQEKFPTTFDRLTHMKNCSEKKWICETHCGKRFKSEWHLKHHFKLDSRFTCSSCPKVCVSRSDLQIHMRSHTNERPYECTICNKKFKTSANRSSHMDIHLEEKIHECNICFEKFQTRPILRKHKKKHDSTYLDQCVSYY